MTIEDIQKQVAERVRLENEGSENKPEPGITSQYIDKCLNANEKGDAELYIALNNGHRLFNQTTGEWMRWDSHHWEIDRGASDALAAMEKVSFVYAQEAKALVDKITAETGDEKKKLIQKQQEYYKRITRLRSIRGSNNALAFTTRTQNRIVATSEQFDQNPWLLPTLNGVIDLRTGELYPGEPADMLIKYCPHNWTGIESKCPLWEKTILEIMDGNKVMVDFLQRLFGYSITGLSNEHILPVMWGKGRNGKGTIIEMLEYVMGAYATAINSEMLMSKTFARSSSGVSPDIMSLKGLRIAFASESEEGKRMDVNLVKRLTGGDTLVGRCPYDKYDTTFQPTHKLFLLTNNQPHAPAHDFAFWQRVVMIPFVLSYVDDPKSPDERPKDKYLKDKLKEEASGILAWMVRGCLQWQESGLDVPSLVKEETAKYQRGEDYLADFIDEYCVLGEGFRESATKLYESFVKWFETNHGKKKIPPAQKRFGELMVKKFNRIKYGINYYVGLKLADISYEE